MRFGKWNVISRAPDDPARKGRNAAWICQCDCGTERVVLGKRLKNGQSKSCGCMKRVNRTGERYGKLTVLEEFHIDKILWYKCICDCGNIVEIKGSDIVHRKSCGCLKSPYHSDFVGKRYGRLVVTEMLFDYDGTKKVYVKCDCDCGTKDYIVPLFEIALGCRTTCGCYRKADLSGKRFGKLEVIEQVDNIGSKRAWLCKCDCGNTATYTTSALNSGKVQSCGCTNLGISSNPAYMISKFLDASKIQYIREYRFEDCRSSSGRKLPFDFFLPEANAVIEYDGEQHFRPINYFGGETQFQRRKENDKIKDFYCVSHGIPILRLPYTLSDSEIKSKISRFYAQESRNDHSLEGNDQAYAGSGG